MHNSSFPFHVGRIKKITMDNKIIFPLFFLEASFRISGENQGEIYVRIIVPNIRYPKRVWHRIYNIRYCNFTIRCIPTVKTARMRYFFDSFINHGNHVFIHTVRSFLSCALFFKQNNTWLNNAFYLFLKKILAKYIVNRFDAMLASIFVHIF